MHEMQQNDFLMRQLLLASKQFLSLLMKKTESTEKDMQHIVSEATGLRYEFLSTLSDQAIFSLLALQQDPYKIIACALAFHRLGRKALGQRLFEEAKSRPLSDEILAMWPETPESQACS